MRHYVYILCLAFVVQIPTTMQAAEQQEIEQIKTELLLLKKQYQEKLELLEKRIQQAEKQVKKAQISAQRAENVARTAAAPKQTTAPTSNSDNSFNPAFSVIFSGVYAAYDEDPEEYRIPGMQLGGESGLAAEGFSVEHTELVMSANIDDKFYAKLTYALASEGSEVITELEEAFMETTSLDDGMKVKLGRFYSDVGYLNSKHGHSWDFVDQPLVYRGMIGGNYSDDGVQFSWLAPTDLYTLVGAELMRGDSFPAGGINDDEFGVQTAYLKLGGDWGTDHSWLAGISFWRGDLEARMGGHAHGEESHEEVVHMDDEHAHGAAADSAVFSGDSDMTILELVYKWAPNGNPTDVNLQLQMEYFQRDEDGLVWLEETDPLEMTRYKTDQSGYYLQGVYQFMPQWRVGLRYDRLDIDTIMDGLAGVDEEVLEESGLEPEGNPDRWSLMLDWSNSEYSRFRVQYNRDNSFGITDNQWYFQYIMSMGAHGAHTF